MKYSEFAKKYVVATGQYGEDRPWSDIELLRIDQHQAMLDKGYELALIRGRGMDKIRYVKK